MNKFGWANCKITAEDVEYIRKNYKFRGGVNSGAELAKRFGLSRAALSKIVNKKVWRYRE